MDVDSIESKTSTSVIVYNSTASTNDVAWQYANNRDNNGLAIFAESQTKGRGRHGNKWLSKPGQSLLCSILLLESNCDLETLTLTVPSEILGGLRVAPLMRGTIGLGKDDSRERDYQEFRR